MLAGCSPEAKSPTTGASPGAAESPAPIFSPPAQEQEPALQKFELTLTLNDPADLRVKQGDRIVKGQILAERRPSEQQLFTRARLQSQLQQRRGIPEEGQLIALRGELAALQSLAAASPMIQGLETRLITLKSEHKATTYQLQQLPLMTRVIDPAYRNQNYRDKQVTLEAKRLQEQTEIALLVQQIQIAKLQAQQEQRAKVAEKQAARAGGVTARVAGVQVQVAQAKLQASLDRQVIADQLRTVDLELERLKARSPYGGTIRRLKVEREIMRWWRSCGFMGRGDGDNLICLSRDDFALNAKIKELIFPSGILILRKFIIALRGSKSMGGEAPRL